MVDKRNKQVPEDNEDKELERRVDEMMDIKRPDPEPSKDAVSSEPGGAPDLPEINIFEDTDLEAVSDDNPAEASKDETTPEEAPAEDAVAPVAVEDPDAVPAENAVEAEKTEEPQKNDPGQIADDKIAEDPSITSPDVDPLVDDIVSSESNELLAAKDAEIAKAFESKPASVGSRIRGFFAGWWHNKIARYGTLLALLALLIAVGSVPKSRYFVLNTAGVRVSASMTVLDNTTGLPLKNVSVQLGSESLKTGKNGVAKFSNVKLGQQQLTIERLGFAKLSQTLVLGLGSNPLGDMNLQATGTQFTFYMTDYLSGKPVGGGEADTSGDASAKADKNGKIILTVGNINSPTLAVTLSADNYRSEKVTVDASAADKPIKQVMVPSRKVVYISKQSGKYDVYKIDVDGKNKKLLLAGTGLERNTISLVQHPTDNEAAVVSSRQNARDQDGYLLDTLTIVNINTGSTLTLDSSEQIRIVDWMGDRIVYVKVKAGTSAGNPERYQLISYDYKKAARVQLASANYFNDIVSAKGYIYYASSDNYRGGPSQFVRVDPSTGGKQVLLTAEVWNILRNSYTELDLSSSQQEWYAYRLGDTSAKKLSQPPNNTSDSRFYLDAPDGKRALWTDQRDGKGVLLLYDASSGKDSVLATQSGLTYPLRWLDDHTVTYRVVTPQETAEYAVSLDGGQPKKITDVTNSNGLGSWSYY